MPLPIETPAPKASSLIKRFQQTIDSADQNIPPPIPKQRLSHGEEPNPNRRSWAIASGGASLPQQAVVWQPSKNKHSPSLPSPADPSTPRLSGSTPELHASPAPLVPQTLPTQTSGSDPSPASSFNANLPASPPLVVSPPSEHLEQPELKPQSPAPTSPLPTAEMQKSGSSSGASKSSSGAAASAERKPKASVSADVALPMRTRKPTNITAPTAASLAKIRSSDSSTPSAASATRNVSTPVISTSAKLPKSSPETSLIKKNSSGARAVAARAARASTSPSGGRRMKTAPTTPQLVPAPSKPRPRSGSLVSSTSTRPPPKKVSPAQPTAKTKTVALPPFGAGPGLRAQSKSPGPAKTARRVLSPAPQPSARTPKAPAGTAGASGGTKAETKRPAQRARVATPVATAKKPAASPAGTAKTVVPGKPGSKTKTGIPIATGSPGRKVSSVAGGGDVNQGDAVGVKVEVVEDIVNAREEDVREEEMSVKGSLLGLATKEDDDRSRVENDAATTNTDGEEEEGPVALSALEVSEMLTMIELDQERSIASRSVPSSVAASDVRASLAGSRKAGDADVGPLEAERPVPEVVVEQAGVEEPESASHLGLATQTPARSAISESDAPAGSHEAETATGAQVVLKEAGGGAGQESVPSASREPEPAAAQVVLKDSAAEPDSAVAAAGPRVVEDTRIADESAGDKTGGVGENGRAAPAGGVEAREGASVVDDESALIGPGLESGAAQVVLGDTTSVAESDQVKPDPSLENPAGSDSAGSEEISTTEPDKGLGPDEMQSGGIGQARPASTNKQAKRRSGIAAW